MSDDHLGLLIWGRIIAQHTSQVTAMKSNSASGSSSKSNKEKDTLQKQFVGITGSTPSDATRLLKKANWAVERAVDLFYSDPVAQSNAASSPSTSASGASVEKKLGEIWEGYKDPSQPRLITIDGTMQLFGEDLEIDLEDDFVIFALASECGSKALGEWEKEGFVKGWRSIGAGIDSLEKMRNALPGVRKKIMSDPAYFKKAYLMAFELSKQAGARTIPIDSAVPLWQAFLKPTLDAEPSALSHIDNETQETSSPQFTQSQLESWLDFQKEKGKAVTKDTWLLLLDFIRTIDKDFETHDEAAAWPSTIDDFVEYARKKRSAQR